MKRKAAPQPKTNERWLIAPPAEVRARLARYLAEKYPGQYNVRNATICAALDKFLRAEGY